MLRFNSVSRCCLLQWYWGFFVFHFICNLRAPLFIDCWAWNFDYVDSSTYEIGMMKNKKGKSFIASVYGIFTNDNIVNWFAIFISQWIFVMKTFARHFHLFSVRYTYLCFEICLYMFINVSLQNIHSKFSRSRVYHSDNSFQVVVYNLPNFSGLITVVMIAMSKKIHAKNWNTWNKNFLFNNIIPVIIVIVILFLLLITGYKSDSIDMNGTTLINKGEVGSNVNLHFSQNHRFSQ